METIELRGRAKLHKKLYMYRFIIRNFDSKAVFSRRISYKIHLYACVLATFVLLVIGLYARESKTTFFATK